MKKFVILFVVGCVSQRVSAQLRTDAGAIVHVQSGATIALTGDLSSKSSILGSGIIALTGTSRQQVAMNGNTIPKLVISNSANVELIGDAAIGQSLNFTVGKIIVAGNLFLENAAVTTGAGAGKFIETIGSGQVKKALTANVTGYLIPVGNARSYTPVLITSLGTYVRASVGVASKGGPHPSRPIAIADYLATYWNITRTGISGTITATGTYEASSIVGNESALGAHLWNGSAWTTAGSVLNTTANQVTGAITGSGGDVYAMGGLSSQMTSRLQVSDNSLLEGPRGTMFGILPNPATASTSVALNMDRDEVVSITIVDLKGAIVGIVKANLYRGYNLQRLDVSTLAKGIYEVQVQSSAWRRTFKLIKQ